MGAPTGLVTLLFTDIEGSTRAWEAHPAEMQVALQRHDEILRHWIEQADGYVFKTVGDAFCAAFADPAQAVRSAAGVQRALAAEAWPPQVPIKVRMGLHSGVCQERDGDYFGPTVNRVARLQATAHGGQLVISGATASLIVDLPSELSLRDMGEHRLKDLGEPEHVYQVCDVELPSDFPPLRSLDSPELMHNLPSQASSFIGREHELDELRGLFDAARVVTLTGAGGVGKTRLALQLAADVLDGSGDGVWFVDLAPLADPGLVAAKAARALGIHEEPGRSAEESLVAALKARRLLLVLDNCEHVIAEAARLVDELARGCPHVVILATSREPLRVAGEHLYRVPSLSTPANDDDDADAVLGSEAVRLFLERAAEQQSGVVLDAESAAVVGRLCRRVDGIPLAIELAAARLRSMSLSDLDRRLDRRLRLLTGGSRTAEPRQQTLEALIDWSYDLLNPVEQGLLDRLSVFAGGFDLDAAGAVAGWERGSSIDVLDGLTALVDKSLVETDRSAMFRYRLLESIRQYAAAKLLARGKDVAATIRTAHRDHYLTLAETAAPHLIGHGQLERLDRLQLELDNLRAAISECAADPDPEPGLRMAHALHYFWAYRELRAEAGAAVCAALDRADAQAPTQVRGRALVCAAYLLIVAGEYDAARERANEALTIARRLSDEPLRIQALRELLHASGVGDEEKHVELADEAVRAVRALSDPHLTAQILYRAASSNRVTHADRARFLKESLTLAQQTGDQHLHMRVLTTLGYDAMDGGEITSARPYLEHATELARDAGDEVGLLVCEINLGFASYLDGVDAAARALFDEALHIAQRHGNLYAVAHAQLGLALIAARTGDATNAAGLHGTADAIMERLGTRFAIVESRLRDADIAALRKTLGDSAFERAYNAARTSEAHGEPALA